MNFFRKPLLPQSKGLFLLIARLTVVFVFMFHGWPKALDTAMAAQKFGQMGFSGFLGGFVGWVEVVSSLLLLLGLFHSLALVLLGIIIVAIVGVQLSQGVIPRLERDLLILAAISYC